MHHNFIRDRDIVLFSFQTWDSEIGFNLKDMAFEFAKYNRVLFVNRASDRASTLRNHKDKKIKNGIPAVRSNKKNQDIALEEVQPGLWVLTPETNLESINWVPSNPVYDFFNKKNGKRLAAGINKAIGILSFKDVILINDNDFFRGMYLKELIPSCSKSIFYLRDFLTIQPYFKKHGPRLEKEIIKKSDLVVANSAYLALHAQQWNAKSFDIGQGCDLQNYIVNDLPLPADMVAIPRPVIGYCGAITSMRLDADIIGYIARSLPACSIVLVGPADAFFKKHEIKDYKNIYFLGGKAPETVPDYIYHFDICINPQVVNLLTIGNYPRKIDEYLAMGKPVVATRTEGMTMFQDHVFLCASKEEYVEKIRLILSNKSLLSAEEKNRRVHFALTHSWENSVGMLGDAYYTAESKN
jgi:teichuronic acid biosynthesis glycosyltransferase TuaH